MGVSKYRGAPKSMVYNGKPYWNGWFGKPYLVIYLFHVWIAFHQWLVCWVVCSWLSYSYRDPPWKGVPQLNICFELRMLQNNKNSPAIRVIRNTKRIRSTSYSCSSLLFEGQKRISYSMYLENLGMIIAFDWTQGWTQHLMASLALHFQQEIHLQIVHFPLPC